MITAYCDEISKLARIHDDKTTETGQAAIATRAMLNLGLSAIAHGARIT
ncbi:hypothetical protein [Pectobacterium cacticida]